MLKPEDLQRLGLRTGQIRMREYVHNGGWYASNGVKLGWGDLTRDDISRISNILSETELFVVLGETDSYWNFVEFLPNDMMRTNTEEKNPGIEYLWDKFRFIIAKGKIYKQEPRELGTAILISKGEAKLLLDYHNCSNLNT